MRRDCKELKKRGEGREKWAVLGSIGRPLCIAPMKGGRKLDIS